MFVAIIGTDLYSDGKIVLLDALIVQWMIDLYICPSFPIVWPLLQVECIMLVGLCCRSSYNPIEHHRVVFYARAAGVGVVEETKSV